MGLVKVWNRNVHPLQEKFKGDDINIPAGGFIVMDEEDAGLYKGQYKPIVRTPDGGHDPIGFKMLHIEPHIMAREEPKIAVSNHICQACSKTFSTKEELDSHIDEKHLDQLQDKELAEKRRKNKAA